MLPSKTHLARSAATVLLLLVVGCTSPTSTQPRSAGPEPTRLAVPQDGLRGGENFDGDHDRGAAAHRRDTQGWVVFVGDSFISGEGARWAGNTTGSASSVDVGGSRIYREGAGSNSPVDCHRVTWPDQGLGPRLRLRYKNLACSGATTVSTGAGSAFKPGLDFHDGAAGEVGQLLALQRFARSHSVEHVVVSIGGNNFGFASVVTRCITAFVTTAGARPAYCKDDPRVTGQFDAGSADQVAGDIAAALRRVAEAMSRAGYQSSDYTIVAQNYPSPLPPGPLLRYRETLSGRFTRGGCPVYDVDATWAHSTAMPVINGAVSAALEQSSLPNVTLLDLSAALDGHRLCETGATQVGLGGGPQSWREHNAAQQLEWVNRLYLGMPPWRVQESWHPNHWGVAAIHSCVRQTVQRVPTATATCSVPTVDSRGKPLLHLVQ